MHYVLLFCPYTTFTQMRCERNVYHFKETKVRIVHLIHCMHAVLLEIHSTQYSKHFLRGINLCIFLLFDSVDLQCVALLYLIPLQRKITFVGHFLSLN